MQHTQTNALYNINLMICNISCSELPGQDSKRAAWCAETLAWTNILHSIWTVFTAFFNIDVLYLDMASIFFVLNFSLINICAEFLTALVYLFIWFSSVCSCCWSSGCLSQNLFAYIYDPVHPEGIRSLWEGQRDWQALTATFGLLINLSGSFKNVCVLQDGWHVGL